MNRRVMRLTSELVGNCGFALPVAGGRGLNIKIYDIMMSSV